MLHEAIIAFQYLSKCRKSPTRLLFCRVNNFIQFSIIDVLHQTQIRSNVKVYFTFDRMNLERIHA
jgi:hypothetical protein